MTLTFVFARAQTAAHSGQKFQRFLLNFHTPSVRIAKSCVSVPEAGRVNNFFFFFLDSLSLVDRKNDKTSEKVKFFFFQLDSVKN